MKGKTPCKSIGIVPNWIEQSFCLFTNWLRLSASSACAFQRVTCVSFAGIETQLNTCSNSPSTPSKNSPSDMTTAEWMNLQKLRVGFMSAQQSLRVIQNIDPALLSLATFPCFDASGVSVGIDEALKLLERELASIRAGLQNHGAASSGI
jgi:hypothetical protein